MTKTKKNRFEFRNVNFEIVSDFVFRIDQTTQPLLLILFPAVS